jgi:hypothetical protein
MKIPVFPLQRIKLALGALFLIFSMNNLARAQTAPLKFQSSDRQTSLLELYTSEGCSSCPPAEKVFSQFKNSPGLWKDFVPVAFHVDYWNYLGWRDIWAKSQFSERQRDYAAAWRSDNIYTPEFILNGHEWSYSSRTPSLANSSATPGVLSAASPDGVKWNISFAPTDAAPAKFNIYAALLISGVSSEVKAGENQGRTLKHDFAAVKFQNAPAIQNGSVVEGAISLPWPKDLPAGQQAIAVWITKSSPFTIVQATGGWIPPLAGN